jgi:hypothetical protein
MAAPVLALLSETPHAELHVDADVERGREDSPPDVDEDPDAATVDAGTGAPRASHEIIKAHRSVVVWARLLGEDAVASLLEAALERERAAADRLQLLTELSLRSDTARPS